MIFLEKRKFLGICLRKVGKTHHIDRRTCRRIVGRTFACCTSSGCGRGATSWRGTTRGRTWCLVTCVTQCHCGAECVLTQTGLWSLWSVSPMWVPTPATQLWAAHFCRQSEHNLSISRLCWCVSILSPLDCVAANTLRYNQSRSWAGK